MKTYYAMTDIHGQFDLLEKLVKRVDKAKVEDSQIVFLGDYIDRGKKSFEVVDFLSRRRNDIFLCGNHDEEIRRAVIQHTPFNFYDSVNDNATFQSYTRNGYDFTNVYFPDNHTRFFRNLWNYYDTEDAFFVHAGVDPYQNLTEQSTNNYFWIRAPFLNWHGPFAKTIVHGHSITKSGKVEFDGRKISVDTGSYKNDKLSCAVIQSGRLIDVIET